MPRDQAGRCGPIKDDAGLGGRGQDEPGRSPPSPNPSDRRRECTRDRRRCERSAGRAREARSHARNRSDRVRGPGRAAVDLPEVHAAAGEVRIRVYAAAVNPTDTSLRNGARAEALRKDPPPYIPGMDAAGVIDEMGAGTATDLAVGDAVMAMVIPTGSHGAYRESIVLAADSVARAPAGCTAPGFLDTSLAVIMQPLRCWARAPGGRRPGCGGRGARRATPGCSAP